MTRKISGCIGCIGCIRCIRCIGCIVCIICLVAGNASAQDEALAEQVMSALRAAVAPALPFPASDADGALPVGGNTTALWMVRPPQAGERTIEILSNPLNEVNQARATRAMAQIGSAIESAQRRSQAQYDRAVAEAKRTGRSQEVDGVTLADEGVAGARIDAESHLTIEAVFNQPSYGFRIASAVEPSPSKQAVNGAVAVIGVPSNVFRAGDEERYCEAESLIYLGRVSAPAVDRRGESSYEVTAGETAPGNGPAIRSIVVRLRGNEALIADVLRTADWAALLELMR